MDAAIENRVAEMLLTRGVRYRIPAHRVWRFFGRKKIGIVLKPMCMGAELEVARIITTSPNNLSLATTPNEAVAEQFILDHYNTVLRIVAVSTLNNKLKIRILTGWRMRQLRRLNMWQLLELYLRLKHMSGTVPFQVITTLATQTRRTAPTMGQMSGR